MDEKSVHDHVLETERDTSTVPSLNEQAKTVTEAIAAETNQIPHVYVTGPKLWAIVVAVTLIVFLMMLDMAIIVTVCTSVLCFMEIVDERDETG